MKTRRAVSTLCLALLGYVASLAPAAGQIGTDGVVAGTPIVFNDGLGHVSSVFLNVARDQGTTGTLIADQTDTAVVFEQGGWIGGAGTGSLNATNGARFTAFQWVGVGAATGGDGTVSIGNGSRIEAWGSLSLGDAAGSVGRLMLTNASTGRVDGFLNVGWEGKGTLSISGGSYLEIFEVGTDPGWLSIGAKTGDSTLPGGVTSLSGTNTANGNPSGLRVHGGIGVGVEGGYGVLNAGGTVEAENLNIHRGRVAIDGGIGYVQISNGIQIAPGGDLTTTDGGHFKTSHLDIDGGSAHFVGFLAVETQDGQAVWDIKNGGFVQNTGVGIGQNTGDTVTINLSNKATFLDTSGSGDMTIGRQGTATINVNGGSRLGGRNLDVGGNTGSSGTLAIEGVSTSSPVQPSGADFQHARLGGSGSAQVNLSNGAYLTANDGITIGELAGGNGSIFVRHAGTSLTVVRYLNVGWEGTGSLRVEDGAHVATWADETVDGQFNIGQRSGTSAAPGGTATIVGSGSELDVAGSINLGTEGGYGVLTIDDSAVADVGGVYVKNGTVQLTYYGQLQTKGSGGVTIDPNGSLDVGFFSSLHAAYLNNNGGTLSGGGQIVLTTGALTNNNGVVNPGEVSNGSLIVAGNFNQYGSGRLHLDLNADGADKLVVQGDLFLDGTVEVAPGSGFAPVAGQSYTVLEWTGNRSTGASFQITGLSLPGGGSLVPVWSAHALALVAVAPPPGTAQTDTFDSNDNWSFFIPDGAGHLALSGGRLNYSTEGTPTANDQLALVPAPGAAFGDFRPDINLLVGRLTSDWSVIVDVHVADFGTLNPDAPTTPRDPAGQGYEASLRVQALHAGLQNNETLNVSAKYDAVWDDRPKAAVSTWPSPNFYQEFDATPFREFKLRASYSAAGHTLSGYISTDGGATWRLQAAFDVTAPVAEGGWGMPAGYTGPAFGINLLARSNNLVVAAGDITFDNFTSSGLAEGNFPPYIDTASPAAGFPNFTWRNPLFSGGTLQTVTFDGNRFVAAGGGGRVLTSADGIAWTQLSTLPSNQVFGLVYTGAQYVAAGSEGIFTSNDAAGWTQRTQGSTGWFRAVATSGSTSIAVGDYGDIAISTDAGTTWETKNLESHPYLQGVAANAGHFVAVGNDGAILVSADDGATWTPVAPPAGYEHAAYNDVAYLNNQFIIVGGNGVVLVSSDNGANWTAPASAAGLFEWFHSIAWDGTRYIATGDGGQAAVSEDLQHWQHVMLPTAASLYGSAAGAGRFVAVGSGGEIQTSPNGLDWTPRGSTGALNHLSDVQYLNGKFVAAGSNGVVLTSNGDGGWTRSTSIGDWINSVAYGNGIYVAVVGWNNIWTSTDAVTWTNTTVAKTAATNGVAYKNGVFVAVGDLVPEGALIRVSTDGVTWLRMIGPIPQTPLRSVAALGDLFIAVGDGGKIYTSSDGQTWTEQASGTNQTLWKVRVIDGIALAVGDNRTVLVSTDGANWVPSAMPDDYNTFGYSHRDIARLRDGFYVVSSEGQFLKSPDLRTWTRVAQLAYHEQLQAIATGGGRVVIAGDGGTLLESALSAAPATPTIAVQPQGASLVSGGNLLLSVVANGANPLTYQWKKDGAPIAGATAAVLVLHGVDDDDAGGYTVVVSDGTHETTSTPAATVEVTVPGVFDDNFASASHWDDWSYPPGLGNLAFTENKLKLVSVGEGNAKTWASAVPKDAISRYVGPYGAPWSVSVRAHLDSGIGTREGDELRLAIQITPETAGVQVSGQLANVGLVRINHAPFPATYGIAAQAVADNRFGADSLTLVPDTGSVEEVIVKLDYTADKKLVASYAIPPETGDPEFITIATYDPVALWGVGTASDFRVMLLGQAIGFGSVAPVHPVFPADGAYFQDFRSTGLAAESIVWPQTQAAAANLPHITAQPNGGGAVGVLPGSGATLQVQATGPSLTYQWRKDSQPIDGATGSSYQITSAGSYDVIVRTAAGSVRSAAVPAFLVEASGAFPDFKWRNPLPSGGSLTAVTYGNVASLGNVFLAVGVDGIMRTSLDGRDWRINATVPAHTILNAVTYSASRGLFIAVGSGGDIYTSSNTAEWTKQASGTSEYFVAVAANDSVIVAGEAGGATYVSADNGVTWTRHKPDPRWSINALAFGAGTFVSVGNGGQVWTSSDGAAWTQITNLPGAASGNAINAVRYLDGQFIAVGGSGLVMTSPNGADWTAHANSLGGYFRDVAKLGGTWVMLDNGPRYLASADLTSFTMRSIPGTSDAFIGAAAGAGRLVLVGGGGEIVSTTDASSWLSHGSTGGLDNFADGVYADHKFVFVGSNGAIATSPDGVQFTRQFNPNEGNWLNAITHDGSQFVAAAYDRILTSPDAIAWTEHNTQLNNGWQGVAANNGRLVAVGDSGRIIASDNGGSNWTEQGSPTSYQLLGVTPFGTGFVAVGQGGTILTSPDGLAWTSRTSPVTNALWRVRALGGKLYAVGDGWTLLTSADGETWTKIPLDTRGGWNVRDIVRLDSGLFLVFGVQGNFYSSPDGVHWSVQDPIVTKEQIEAVVVGPDSLVLGGRGGLLLQSALPATTPPTIAVAPASQTVAPGSNFALTVTVSGPGPYSYQWFRNGNPIPGATRPRLPFVDADAGDNGDYTVTVYGVGGSVVSGTATIAVGEAPAGSAITDFSPTTLAAGLQVAITGTNFNDVTAVRFNGLNAESFTVDSSTHITAIVPVGVTTGAITVVTSAGTTASTGNYTLTTAPIITGFEPASGPVKSFVRIHGANFQGFDPQVVKFNGVVSDYPKSWGNNGITLIVPPGATTGPITVQTSQGTATSATDFTVATGPAPTNDDFANAQAIGGTSGSVTASLVNATKETGEPDHAGNAGGASVWFAWTAPSAGVYAFRAVDELGGKVIGIYTGSAVSSLTPVASAVSADAYESSTTAVLTATEGTSYLIAVDGFDGISMDFSLEWSAIGAPTVTGFTPTGYAGQTVGIWGTGFIPGAEVSIGGVAIDPADIRVSSTTSILIERLPYAATTGPITVTTPVGSATSEGDFVVTAPPPPSIDGFSPTNGQVGTSVQITGTALALGDAPPIVKFNGTPVQVGFFERSDYLSVVVPAEATTGVITVQTSGGTATSSGVFTVVAPPTPTIESFSPTSIYPGLSITITGTNFTGVTAVSFNGIDASSFTVDSDTRISAVVPNGVTSGPITIGTTSGSVSSGSPFTVVAAPPPANDNFANAQVLDPAGGSLAATTIGATNQSGEPIGGASSLWYKLTPAVSGRVQLTVTQAGNPVVRGVYVGGSLSTLSQVAVLYGGSGLPLVFDAIGGLTYYVVVGSWAGSEGVIDLSWGPTALVPPKVIVHPKPCNVTPNAAATFAVAATGTGPLTYQWWRIPAGNNFFDAVPLAENSTYTGVTTDTLTVAATLSMTGDQFYCIVSSDVQPAASSNWAMLTVVAADHTSHTGTAILGSGENFDSISERTTGILNGGEIEASLGNAPTLSTYNYLQRGIADLGVVSSSLGDVNPIPPSGFTQSVSLSVGHTYVALIGMATDAPAQYAIFRTTGLTSTNVTLDYETVFDSARDLAILQQPQPSTILAEGAPGQVAVNAIGHNLSYQWQKKNGSDFADIEHATSRVLRFNGDLAEAGDYRVKITDAGNNALASTPAHVTVNPTAAPAFTQQPAASAVIASGGSRTLSFQFDAVPAPTVYVVKDGVALPTWSSPVSASYYSDGTDVHFTVDLNFSDFDSADVGAYQIALSSPAGGALSASVNVAVAGRPTVASLSPGTNLKAGMTVTITGTNFIDASKVKFGELDAASFHVNSATQITAVAPANLVDGAVTVTGPAGTSATSGTAAYTTAPRPVITQQPQNRAATSGDHGVTFAVTATGTGTLTYQWRRFGFPIEGATGSTYTLGTVLLGDTDYYDVVVSDDNGSTTSAMARLDVAPTSYPGQIGVDKAWSVPTERDSVLVSHVLPLASGDFLVAGDFSKVGGHLTGAVARFKANGSVDTAFVSPLAGAATKLALQSDGKILVAGGVSVETAQGSRAGLVRLNADGSVDATFAPDAKGAASAVAIAPDGKIYAGLPFGADGAYRLVRLNAADGSQDGTFVPPYPTGAYVYALAVQPGDGKIVVSARVATGTAASGAYEIHRLLVADGSQDVSFTPLKVNYVPALSVGTGGKIYIGGSVNPNDFIYSAARLNSDGTLDGSFARLAVDGSISALSVEAGDSVIIGGSFTKVNNVPRSNVARLNSDGTLAAALNTGDAVAGVAAVATLAGGDLVVTNSPFSGFSIPVAVRLKSDNTIDSGFAPAWRAPGRIHAMVRQADGRLVIAGDFMSVGGTPQLYLARIDADGNVDTSFASAGRPNAFIQLMKGQADGKLLLAGVFSKIGDTTQEAWARLSVDGVRDTTFVRGPSSSSYLNEKLGLLTLPGGSAIVGSWWFYELTSGGFIKLNSDGSHDASFSAKVGTGLGHPITGVVQTDGRIVLGGFSWLTGNTALMRLNADGSIEHNYSFNLATVFGSSVTADGKLWVAHSRGLARYLPNGDADPTFASPSGLGIVYLNTPLPPTVTLIPQNDGKMIVPRAIIPEDAPAPLEPDQVMVRLTSTGSLDPTFSLSGLTAPITAIVQRDDGQFYLASEGVLRRTKALAAPAITTSPAVAPSVLTGTALTLSVEATGDYLTYQWRKDGVALPGATTATLTIPALKTTDNGDYDVVVSNAAGSQTSAAASVVAVPAIITAAPQPATILAGGNATFSVTANTHFTPLTYQWRRNGLNIAGATSATLTLNNVPLNGGGAITVAIANSAGGSVVSTPVALTVNPIAPVITSPLTASGVIGRSFTYQTGTNTVATFSATGLPAGLTINASTGVITGTPTAVGSSNVAITAHNVSGDDTRTLVLTINPPPPVISSPVAAASRVGQTGFSYTIAASNSPTGYEATDLPPGLTLNASTGVISGTPTQAGTFISTIKATNASGSVSQTVQFAIQPALNAPAYSGTTQPSGTQNALFSFTPTFANGVTSYAIASGTLPAGLTLNPTTGAITGTPTAVGRFNVTLRATGPGGVTDVPLSFIVNPAPTAPIITSASTVTTTVGASNFSFQLTTDQLTTGLLTTGYNAAPLPAGISLHEVSGLLDGTPSAAGTTAVQVSATNLFGTGPTSVLVVTVNPSPNAPVITSPPVVEGRVDVETTGASPLYQISVNHPADHFSVTSGDLPPGLTLDADTGAVSGKPTAAGSYRAAFAATSSTDGKGPSLEVLFTIKPALNVPVVTSNSTAAGQVGQPFSYTITATNAPTSFTATGLPAWMTQSGALLSGIPTTATTTPLALTIAASNNGGASASKTVLVTIAPAPATPAVTSATTAGGRVGLAFNYRITASASPTSFSALNLPPGLTLDPATGVISGTPTQAGSFNVKLSAGNTAGVGPNTTLVLNIAPAPQAPTIISNASATGKVGVAFTYDIVATPGTITGYEVTGTLPLGLSVNTIEGTITGKPAEPGLFLVEMTATSAAGTSLPQMLLISINPADNVPVITSATVALATVGDDFGYTITATNMPLTTPFPPAITLDAVNLPPGLAINPSTGRIQGRPSVAGLFTATLVGTNAAGTGPFRDLIIYVQPATSAPVITSSSSAPAQVGVPFHYEIAATNYPEAYEVVDPPAWMTINGQSGILGGVPSAPGTFKVKLIATNSAGDSNPLTLTLFIAPAAGSPVISSTRTVFGKLGDSSFSYRITASNTPTAFVASGLPAGLTLNSATGVISGTPQASGTFPVTISAENASGASLPVTLTLVIDGTLQLVPGT